MKPKGKRRDALARRELIISAAAEVFQKRGYNAPLEEIITRSGVGRGTLYRNFKDRQSLALAVLDRALDRLEALASELEGDDGAIFKLLRALASIVLVTHDLVRDVRAELPSGDPTGELRERIERVVALPLERAIATGLIRPDLRPADITPLAIMIVAPAEQLPVEARGSSADTMMRLLVEGLLPR